MTFSVTEDAGLEESVMSAIRELKNFRVEIGLPETASARNRWLLALHERGAPGAHIPPRPVVGPALKAAEAQEEIRQGLLAACRAAEEGNAEGITAGLEHAGEAGVRAIRAYIDKGVPPPNAPITVSGGWMRNIAAGKPVRVEGKGFNKPLYATGELYNAFGYEVKK